MVTDGFQLAGMREGQSAYAYLRSLPFDLRSFRVFLQMGFASFLKKCAKLNRARAH